MDDDKKSGDTTTVLMDGVSGGRRELQLIIIKTQSTQTFKFVILYILSEI